MAAQDRLINNLHKIFREDPYIIEQMGANAVEFDAIEALLQRIYNNLSFDTMDGFGSALVANQLGVKLNPNLTQEEQNSLLEARWKTSGKSDLALLQNICDSWRNGSVDVDFENGTIQITFIGIGGIPTDLVSLQDAIDKAKPAHLLVDYIFTFLTWNMLESYGWTWDDLESQNLTWNELEIKVTP